VKDDIHGDDPAVPFLRTAEFPRKMLGFGLKGMDVMRSPPIRRSHEFD